MEAARESPEYVRCSLAAAITLGLKPGRFWRGARLYCVNLLLTYEDGCVGACAYCGLNRRRTAEMDNTRAAGATFIRVEWPVFPLREILACLPGCSHVQRVCISMVAHRRAREDTLAVVEAVRRESAIPISALITPTLVDAGGLERLRMAGVDKIGIAIDAATPEIFDRLRGRAVGGPHRWETYWQCFAEAVEVFGRGNVGSHFIAGLGEAERDMVAAFQTVRDLGGSNQLFSFYPEAGSAMEHADPPPMAAYRRLQLAAYLIDAGRISFDDFLFDPETGAIASFGLPADELERIIADGEAFMTRGCAGRDGRTACNRPFANSPPGPALRNFPFPPEPDDLERIRRQLAGEWRDEPPSLRRLRPIRREILFFAPSIKHFDTDEYTSSGKPVYIAASVTGRHCDLQCLHCGGCLLKCTYPVETPEALWDLALRLKDRGLRGVLLTGGCTDDGVVPLAGFCPMLARLKSDLGLETTVHSKLVDRRLADALCLSRATSILVDVVGSLDMLQRVYRLPDKTLDDVRRSLDLLAERELPISPHVVLDNLAGGDGASGDRALAMLEGRTLRSLVIVMLMALPGHSAGPTIGWDLREVRRLFEKARMMFPKTPLLLGCARPLGPLQKQIDALALDAGFDGIAFPSEGTAARARELGRTPRFSEFCCSLLM